MFTENLRAIELTRTANALIEPNRGRFSNFRRIVAHPDRTFFFKLNVRIAADPPAISKHVEEERVILTPSEHEALARAYADSSTE